MANILEDVQQYVVGKLSADWQLSGCCQFLAESRKDIDYEIKNALGRQGIVGVCMTPKATYAGKFEDLFLAWTLEELEIDIVENVTVNRGKKNGQWMTGQQIALRVFDVLCPLSGEFEGQFNPVSIEEGEDNGLVVNKCILKALVYGEHGDVPQPEKPITYQFVKLLDQPPPLSVQPHDGWMWNDDGQLFFYVDHEAHKLGDVTQSAMSAYVESQISSKAEISSVEAVADGVEDLSSSLSDYYTKSDTSSNIQLDAKFETKADLSSVPTKTSDLSNDSGFITSADISSKADLSALSSYLRNDSNQTLSGTLSWKVPRYGQGVKGSLACNAVEGVVHLYNNQAGNEISFAPSFFNGPSGNVVYWPTLNGRFAVDSELSAKRDLNDLNIYADPMAEHTPIEVTVWHTSEISTLYILNWDESSWYYRDDVTTIQIYFDNYSNTYIMTGTIQDMGGTSHSISKSFDLTPPFWSVDFEIPYFFKIEVVSVKAHITTKEYVDAHLSVLESDIPTKTSDLSNDSGFITAAALTPYREKSDLYYEHSFHKANWQNVPRFIMNYDGTQTVFDKFDSTLSRWTVSTGTSDWYVQESLVGMEGDPQFTLMRLDRGIETIQPTEGAGTTTVTFIVMEVEGTFTMDMSDQLVCKMYVDRQLTALEARIAALEGN